MGLIARDGSALPLRLAGDESAATLTERVLVLDQAEQSFVFEGLAEAPVPSLLRGFSAPVHLDDGLTDGDRLLLLANDSDAFNRWEAGQRLALARLLAALSGAEVDLDDAFVEAMRSVLRHRELDPAFKELVLTLPSEGVVAERLVGGVDPQRIHAVRERFLDQLAQRLQADWEWAWQAHQVVEGYLPSAEQSGRRALANLALAMLVRQAVAFTDPVWPGRAFQRVKDAVSMTDRLGALSALVDSHAELAEPALARFHALFADEPLVIDKWFALQARAPERDGRVMARAKALLRHADFSLTNPNRARSLVMALCLFNPAAFHRIDAAGYVFWGDRVIEIDAINPQLASRLARALDRWQQLAEPYRSAAREAIARVAARPELSDDTREIVSRALAGS
jgi:aminopeptidase N